MANELTHESIQPGDMFVAEIPDGTVECTGVGMGRINDLDVAMVQGWINGIWIALPAEWCRKAVPPYVPKQGDIVRDTTSRAVYELSHPARGVPHLWHWTGTTKDNAIDTRCVELVHRPEST